MEGAASEGGRLVRLFMRAEGGAFPAAPSPGGAEGAVGLSRQGRGGESGLPLARE
jgi:hypothetical protein